MTRREALPADRQRPPGNPVEEGAGSEEVAEFMGEEVGSGDEQTTGEDTLAAEAMLECPACDKTFKTERGLESHVEAKHL